MSLTRGLLTSSGQLMLANAMARVLAVISLPLLTQWLAPSAFGQAALASTLMSLVAVVGLMGMDMSYARGFLSRSPPNGQAVETMLWRLALGAAFASGAIAATIWVLYSSGQGSFKPELAVLIFFGAAGSVLLAMGQTRSRVRNRHSRLAIATAIGGLTATGVALGVAKWINSDERALVASYVAAYVVPLLIVGLPSIRQLRVSSGLSTEARRAVFLTGLPGIVAAPAFWVISSLDRWFLDATMDATTVGIYAVAGTFGQMGMMVNSALLAIWLPEATRIFESSGFHEGQRVLSILVGRVIAVMMVVWVGVSTFGGDMLRWLSEDRYHPGAEVVPWLAGGIFLYGCYHLFNTGLFLGRKLKFSAAAWILAAGLSVAANAYFVPRFGMIAAALVQCVAFLVLAVTVLLLAQRSNPIPLRKGRLVAMFLVALVAASIGAHMPIITGFSTFIGKSILITSFAVVVLLLVSFENAPRH